MTLGIKDNCVWNARCKCEDVMCIGFAENKGMQQENVSIKKRQKGRRKPWKLKGGWQGGKPNSAEQRFAPEGESNPPTSLP